MNLNAKFLPLIEEAITGASEMRRPRAIVFRKTPGWLQETDYYVASFVEPKLAHDFCSMMESEEHIWTVCEIHPDEHRYLLGNVIEWHGGRRRSL